MGRKEAALPGSSVAPDHGGGMPLFKACLLSLQLLMGPSLAVASVFLSFRDCSHFFHKRTPPLGVHGASLKSICQRFRDKARYATLYDGGRRLALYSAYVFKKSDGQGRADTPWMYEPQVCKAAPRCSQDTCSPALPMSSSQMCEKQVYSRGELNA